MNTNSRLKMDDDFRFDRLVDGELSPEEYKALLSTLDDEPGGWRRCALAFLESQAWSSEFAAIRRVQTLAPVAADSQPALDHSRVTSPAAWSLLLVVSAASFVLAFSLGLASHSHFFSRANPAVASGENDPSTAMPAVSSPGVTKAADPNQPLGNMKLVVNRGAGLNPAEIDLPVYDANSPQASTIASSPPAIPDSLIRAMELRGHHIQRQEDYLPVQLEDGRQVVFPVEEYRITPVSRKSY